MSTVADYRRSAMDRLNEQFPYEFLSQKEVMKFCGYKDRKSFLDQITQFQGVAWPVPKDFVADVIAERNAKLSKRFNANMKMGVYR